MSKLIEGEHFYFNEAGLMVLTSKFHLQRGYCCGNGCLHCPYNYEQVPEPQRTALLKARKDNKPSNDKP